MQGKLYRSGFTILELLVVIALVGLIALVSFAYMKQSKDKGGDAGVEQALINARSQAEVYYANQSGSYEGVCTDVPRAIFKLISAAARAQGITPNGPYADDDGADWDAEACHDSPDEYVVWVPLSGSASGAGNARGLCIDSHNVTRESTDPLAPNEMRCPTN